MNVGRKCFLRCVIVSVVVSAVWKLTIDTYLNLADTGVYFADREHQTVVSLEG